MRIALESTLITHGFPPPGNLEVAYYFEDIARGAGCRPLTIGIINGEIKVGMTHDEIRQFESTKDVIKAGVRELPQVIAKKQTASTTVSATMRIAFNNNIPVFATGGIGGVHPGPWDVSQDIFELSRTNMIVVSAGPKAILDLKTTYEMLESFGVTVVGYRTDEMPAFYTRKSGFPITRVDSAEEIVSIYRSTQALKLPNAVMVFNPIPADFEIDEDTINAWLDRAHADQEKMKVTGKMVTPFLLQKMADYSEGKTIESNIELIKNNVLLGCEIARALNRPYN